MEMQYIRFDQMRCAGACSLTGDDELTLPGCIHTTSILKEKGRKHFQSDCLQWVNFVTSLMMPWFVKPTGNPLCFTKLFLFVVKNCRSYGLSPILYIKNRL
jgi:phage terminase large subunit-like protein